LLIPQYYYYYIYYYYYYHHHHYLHAFLESFVTHISPQVLFAVNLSDLRAEKLTVVYF
jgi:hypothetical protein